VLHHAEFLSAGSVLPGRRRRRLTRQGQRSGDGGAGARSAAGLVETASGAASTAGRDVATEPRPTICMYVSIAEYRNLVSAERKAEDWRGANRKSQVSFSHATTSPFRETPSEYVMSIRRI
jgi:hypothetical protein